MNIPPWNSFWYGKTFSAPRYIPMQAFDRDTGIGSDLSMSAIGLVGRVDDDMRIGDGGGWPIPRLDVASEPIVDVLPAAAGFFVFFHVVRRRVPECLDFPNGFWGIDPLVDLVGVAMEPILGPGTLIVDGPRLDRVLQLFDGRLVHDEVEMSVAVVDIAAFFVLAGHPVEHSLVLSR